MRAAIPGRFRRQSLPWTAAVSIGDDPGVPRLDSPYGGSYGRDRAALLSTRPHCALRLRCTGDLATEADHVPPLSEHEHRNGSGCCRLQPACSACQREQALRLGRGRRGPRRRNRPRPPAPSRRWL